MYFSCYVRQGKVYLPTYGKVEAGFYRAVDPVLVSPLDDSIALKQALSETIIRGNPSLPHLKRDEYPPPVLPKYAGMKSWTSFVRGASVWAISDEGRDFYTVTPMHEVPQHRGLVEDETRTVILPAGLAIGGICDRIIDILRSPDM